MSRASLFDQIKFTQIHCLHLMHDLNVLAVVETGTLMAPFEPDHILDVVFSNKFSPDELAKYKNHTTTRKVYDQNTIKYL